MKIECDCLETTNTGTKQRRADVPGFGIEKGLFESWISRRKNYSKQLEIILSGNHFQKRLLGIQSEEVGK